MFQDFSYVDYEEKAQLCGFKKLRTTSYRHKGIGMVERLVQTVKCILRYRQKPQELG